MRRGIIGGNPEVHEKIAPSGKGVVCVFSDNGAVYRYVTERTTVETWCSSAEKTRVTRLPDGRAEIELTFTERGAQIIFFGAKGLRLIDRGGGGRGS